MPEERFNNKYRTNTLRLAGWDYSQPGLYFVTICTKERISTLAEIKDNQVYMPEIGKIVFEEWIKTQKVRPNVILHDFIIMPNHVHGIVEIKNIKDIVETHSYASLQKNTFGPQRRNLAAIIRGFKATSKKNIVLKLNNYNFQWQKSYYEHIIRAEDDYARINKYIVNNPINWKTDKNNPDNIKKYEQ